MGLIKAIAGAIGSTMKDQWLDLIKYDNMDMETLMVKQTTKSGQISKGSRILVAPGQVAVIYDSGAVLDATAEEGVYTFDQSSSPSFFGGQFGPVFKEMWQRFTYGGTPAKEQAIFFFNAKEILDNKFGTATPIPFQDWSHAIPNQMTGSLSPMGVNVRCYGKYTFRLDDVALFMRNHAGTGTVVKKKDITEQMRSEVIAAFQNVLNEMGNSKHRVPVLELPSYTDEMKQVMDERVFDEPIRARGVRLVSFTVESVSLDEASQEKIDRYEYSSNSMMQQGKIIDVMGDAANNPGGAGNAFIGLGMMIPALVLIGLGHGIVAAVAAGLIFGIGYGMFDTNNMPILCQFVPSRLRATAYGFMNTVGVAMGAVCTQVLGRMQDGGHLGAAFAVLGVVTAAALLVQLVVLKPVTDDMA